MATTYLKFDPRLLAFTILLSGVMILDCPVASADELVGQVDSTELANTVEPRLGFLRRRRARISASAAVRHPTDPMLDGQVGDQPQIGETTYGPIFAQSSNCAHGLRCVDRNGQGMIGELGMKHGIGPCNDVDCECWQCPYNAPFNLYGPGEYAGPARIQRISEYRLRAGDTVEFTFLSVGYRTEGAYRLVVGDELLIESEADENITRGTLEHGLLIQPDGTITLRLIGQIHAAGQSIEQLRAVLNQKYTEYYDEPNIDVTPVRTGAAARHVREAISGSAGFDPQRVDQTLSPSGEIRMPRLGSIQAQGLTLDELKQEINLRYDATVGGLEVEPSLLNQAPHNVFVLGEVQQPGRFDLDNSPTTVLGAIAMAGGHVPGANLRQVVVFRRGESYELLSTLLDVRGAILGREAHPADEIWLRDGDVIVLPSTPIRLMNNLVRQVFTEGIYGVVPFSTYYNFNGNSL